MEIEVIENICENKSGEVSLDIEEPKVKSIVCKNNELLLFNDTSILDKCNVKLTIKPVPLLNEYHICSICSQFFGSKTELIEHGIEHGIESSDESSNVRNCRIKINPLSKYVTGC